MSLTSDLSNPLVLNGAFQGGLSQAMRDIGLAYLHNRQNAADREYENRRRTEDRGYAEDQRRQGLYDQLANSAATSGISLPPGASLDDIRAAITQHAQLQAGAAEHQAHQGGMMRDLMRSISSMAGGVAGQVRNATDAVAGLLPKPPTAAGLAALERQADADAAARGLAGFDRYGRAMPLPGREAEFAAHRRQMLRRGGVVVPDDNALDAPAAPAAPAAHGRGFTVQPAGPASLAPSTAQPTTEPQPGMLRRLLGEQAQRIGDYWSSPTLSPRWLHPAEAPAPAAPAMPAPILPSRPSATSTLGPDPVSTGPLDALRALPSDQRRDALRVMRERDPAGFAAIRQHLAGN